MDGTRQPVGRFRMADVRHKRAVPRRAVARGTLHLGMDAFVLLAAGRLPKGDALALAEVAGVNGAKQAAWLLPLCHPLPLELVRVHCELDATGPAVHVYCEVAVEARTGVEMEALAGVSAALLTLYDLIKPVDPALALGETRLLFKEGGKSGLWRHPAGMTADEEARFKPRAAARLDGKRAAVATLSDRAHAGQYDDRSGPLLVAALAGLGADVLAREVLPDDGAVLQARLRAWIDDGIDLVLCTGGTGLGARDITPEALAALGGRTIDGLGDLFRDASAAYTPLAWLSRATAVLCRRTLILALPGSPKAVREGMEILAPILPHALAMIAGEEHPA
ncbi:bifunctional molybdenum cofactor biosynthesis protein MoaC/MoaB [Rehaibacterium terrae]|jgi:cyclic pyranopterin phosphate synthase|uniref:Molybdenum cofactor biosynthesis protein MoaC n=1 Tax=Rehaibacterium terrae TaxID=1341696 RepID=A0A7W7Y1L4_9GAMM|nr:bifunctional molybdenum cofactor biosynthesis protein MoaC/MoaB [Rehaibacterium terrae]MBB5016432.1 molybdenum cofactor biosynthesis protein MoaC [Rehaibacterium terrae]